MALRSSCWKLEDAWPPGDIAEIEAIAEAPRAYLQADVALCVPTICIERAARAVSCFVIGGQDIHHAEEGAHTG